MGFTTLSQYDYYCPSCQKQLSENGQVVFLSKRNNSDMFKMFLDPKPGNYNYKCDPEVSFDQGEMVDFYCPHCKEDLKSSKFEKFVKIDLKVTDKVLIDVFFSRVYGDRKTYVGIEDFEEEYGKQIRKH